MTPKQLIASIQKNHICVTVFRHTNGNYEQDPASKVGQKWIILPEDFCTTVLRSSDTLPKATLVETYEIQNMFFEKTGTIVLSFRLCCFGSAVVTQMRLDYLTQAYNFRYLSKSEAFKCYNQSKELQSNVDKMKLQPLLTDSDNILDMKTEFVTTKMYTEKPVNWKAYNQQCFSDYSDAQTDITSKIKSNGTEVLTFGPKCECANILDALYKKSKAQSIPLMLEERQQNFNILKSRVGTGHLSPVDSKFLISKKISKRSIKSKQSTQELAGSVKRRSKQAEDTSKIVHEINDKTDKPSSISPKDNLPLNQITNITEPAIHTTTVLESKRKRSTVSEILQKTDHTRSSKTGRSRKKVIYDYTTGVYPGVRFGHSTCLDGPKYVPKTMGWLWNIPDQVTGRKKRPGWKPGIISKTISKMIKAVKGLTVSKAKAKGSSRKIHSSKRMVLKTIPPTSTVSDVMKKAYDSDEEISPTLQLYKKGQVYCIQMNTIKEDSGDEQDPVRFKVVPDDDKSAKSSRSSVAVRFIAPGALYKRPIKPDVAEVCTQYSEMNFGVEEILPPKNGAKKRGCKEKNIKKASAVSLSASNKSKRILWDDSSVPTEVSKF